MSAPDLPSPTLSAAVQLELLRRDPNCAGTGSIRAGRLTWRFKCTPTTIGRTYLVEIKYKVGSFPEAIVVSPNLPSLAEGRRLPHVYSEDPVSLCLWLPAAREWHPGLRLDQTYVPWTYLWLDYFEDWLLTDVWHGGGEHPGDRPMPRSLRQSRNRRDWQR